MNATVKADRFSNGSEAVIRMENGCTVHITARHIEAYAPGGGKLFRHHSATISKHSSTYDAVVDAFKAASKWVPNGQ